MKHLNEKPVAQGDLNIFKIDCLPEGCQKVNPESGQFILAHSETGHHHIVLERGAQLFINETNEFIKYLQVGEPTEVRHMRSFDTHESIALSVGTYKLTNQREYVPEGYRRAAD